MNRSIACVAFLLVMGMLTLVRADSNLDVRSAYGLSTDNPGRHLALGYFKQNPSFTMPDKGIDRALTVSAGRNVGNLHLHGYRDAPNVEVVANPEPTTMLLLGTGLFGVVAVLRKKRGSAH